MMLENHLRHVKPSEFNRSVIWAGRIGLFLLLMVAVLVILPFAAQQVQGVSMRSSSFYPDQLYSAKFRRSSERRARVSQANQFASVGNKSLIGFEPVSDPSMLVQSEWLQLAYQQGNE